MRDDQLIAELRKVVLEFINNGQAKPNNVSQWSIACQRGEELLNPKVQRYPWGNPYDC